jgi:hypothetical protein
MAVLSGVGPLSQVGSGDWIPLIPTVQDLISVEDDLSDIQESGFIFYELV